MVSPIARVVWLDLLFALVGAVVLNALIALTFLDRIKVPDFLEDLFLALCLPTLLVVRNLSIGNLVALIAVAVTINIVLHGVALFLLVRLGRGMGSIRLFRSTESR